jgi:NADH-quinone oxidoreductase subunit J
VTSRPRPISLDRSLLPGLAALALFGLVAAVVLAADTSVLVDSWGFTAGESIVGSIGAALIGIEAAIPVESFVVALLVMALALDAALDGSLMLAKRDDEEDGEPLADGGER